MNTSAPVKKTLLALTVAAALGLSFSALAQNEGPRGQRLAEELNLTTEQQAEIDALRSAHRETMQGLRAERQEARTALHEEIRSVLTAEQAEKFDAMEHRRAERRQNAQYGGRGRKGGCDGERRSQG
jgi:Spy/CpxP family protein refolding chaperone